MWVSIDAPPETGFELGLLCGAHTYNRRHKRDHESKTLPLTLTYPAIH